MGLTFSGTFSLPKIVGQHFTFSSYSRSMPAHTVVVALTQAATLTRKSHSP